MITQTSAKRVFLSLILLTYNARHVSSRAVVPVSIVPQTKNSVILLQSLRGGAATKPAAPATVKKTAAAPTTAHAHHEEHLMTPATAVANVLADLCPHGMMPLGM